MSEATHPSAPAAASPPSEHAVSLTLSQVIQDYPAPGGGVTRVIGGVDLNFERPGINMLLGPSGSGKSTLLNMMGGVRPLNVKTPTSGSISIDGQPCHGPHADAVMVFQRYANRPDLSVYDNIAFPFRFKLWRERVPEKEWRARVEHMLDAVGLADK